MEETKACSCQGDSCQATNFARSIVENAIGFILNRCSKSTAINSVCQKFTPTVVEPPRPTSHSVEAGSYFPSPVQSIVEPRTPGPKPPGPSPSTSAAPPVANQGEDCWGKCIGGAFSGYCTGGWCG